MTRLGLQGMCVGLLAGAAACGMADAGGELGPTDEEGTGGDGDGDSGTVTGSGTSDGGEGDGDGDGEDTSGPDDFVECTPDCGPHGVCVSIGDAVSVCDCEDGYEYDQAAGCFPCAAQGGSFDIDVPVVAITAAVLVNGSPAPASEYDDANLWLENPRRGDRVLLGNTHDGDLAVRVVPGLYDLVYEHETGSGKMPINRRAVLRTQVIEDDTHLTIDIEAASVGGKLWVNGAEPPSSEYDDGELLVRGIGSDVPTVIGNTHDGAWNATLLAGDYQVHYRLQDGGDAVPINEFGFVRPLTAQVSEVPVDIDIDIRAHAMSGPITLDGAVPPASEYDDGLLVLETTDGDRAVLGNTHDQTVSALVIEGDYDLYYVVQNAGPTVPRNEHAWVEARSVQGPDDTGVAVTSVRFYGAFRLNGGTTPASEFDDGVVSLADRDGDRVWLGNTHDGAFDVSIVPGTYDVYYSTQSPGAQMPGNVGARLFADLTVDADVGMDLDVEAAVVTGAFSIDGAQPPDSEYADGRVYLSGTDTEDSVLLGNTADGGFSAIVVPGAYHIRYVEETAGNGVPANQDALVDIVDVVGAMSLDIDIPTVLLTGDFLLAGEPTPDTPSDAGDVHLRRGHDSVLLGSTHKGSYAAQAVAGGYGLYYRSTGAGPSMPQNTNGRFGCITLE
jgi:hypothetical protein